MSNITTNFDSEYSKGKKSKEYFFSQISHLNIKSKLKYYFKNDYNLIQKVLYGLGIIGTIVHPVFYFVLFQFASYWESFPLRLIVTALYFSFIFFPKNKTLNRYQIWYYDFAMTFSLPVFFLINLN